MADATDQRGGDAWHWDEKDLKAELDKRMAEAFQEMALADETGTKVRTGRRRAREGWERRAKATADDPVPTQLRACGAECYGEVILNTRKGRKFVIVSVKVVVEYSGRLEIGTTVTGSSNGVIVLPEVGNNTDNSDPETWEVEVMTMEEKKWKAQGRGMQPPPKPKSDDADFADDDNDAAQPSASKPAEELYLTHEDKVLKARASAPDVIGKVKAAVRRTVAAVEAAALGQATDAPAPASDGASEGTGKDAATSEEVQRRVAEMRVAGRPKRVKEALERLAANDDSYAEVDLTYSHVEADAVDELFHRLVVTTCPLTAIKLSGGHVSGLTASHLQALVARLASGGLPALKSLEFDPSSLDAMCSNMLKGLQVLRKDVAVTYRDLHAGGGALRAS